MTFQLRLAYLEFKKAIFNKEFAAIVLVVLGILYLLPYGTVLQKTKSLPEFTLPIIMIVYFSQILTCDFEHKTFKVLFTGGLTRLQVLISKVMSMMAICMLFFLSYQFLLVISQIIDTKSITFDYKIIANSMLSFILYSLVIITFEMLLMSITLNFAATFIITFMCFNSFVTDLFRNATNKLGSGFMQKVIEYAPFRVAADGLKLQSFTAMQTIVLTISSLAFFLISSFILLKKDLR
ncbi:MAG TPA: hypothetical protein PLM73_11020 [Petrotogaceae bacterium]|nr:hypothetical protein [Petrotogaceae bacterium]